MATIVKHEWHSTDRQYCLELDEALLSEIYPDLKKRELKKLAKEVEAGEADIDQIINDAWENDIELEWDFQYDDCWTDRKGGYEVTYEYGDEDSYHTEPADLPKTHKCSKCRWEGHNYDTLTQYFRADGTVIEDFYGSDEEADHTKEVCPMCDSDVVLTEAGEVAEQERAERMRRWKDCNCVQCEWTGMVDDAVEGKDGELVCPECGEPIEIQD